MKTQQRPTGLGHGVYKDDIDYSVLCGQWCIGRIYENRSGPESCAGSGRCIPPASQAHYASWTSGDAGRGKAEFEASGGSGRPGRSWKRLLDGTVTPLDGAAIDLPIKQDRNAVVLTPNTKAQPIAKYAHLLSRLSRSF